MNYLTADDSLQDLLRGVVEPVEIRDPSGKVLGHYTPAVSPEEAELYEKAKALFDPAEMERRLANEHGKGATLDAVMQRLRSLGAPG
jgi:hypothetical protein